MNNEQNNQIINDAYENYYKNAETSNLIDSHYEPATNKWHLYNREEFIDRCKTDSKISDKWGLKIEEKELDLEERSKIWNETHNPAGNIYTHNQYNENNIPAKLITVTYKDKTIESYE